MKNLPKTETKLCRKTNPDVSVDIKNKDEKNVIRQAPVYFKVDVKALDSNKKRPTFPPFCKFAEDCKCKKKYIKTISSQQLVRKRAAVVDVEKSKEPIKKLKWESKLSIINEAKDKSDVKCEALKSDPSALQYVSSRKPTWSTSDKKNVSRAPDVIKLKKNKPKTLKKGEPVPNKTASMALYKASLGSYMTIARWKIFNYGERGSGFQTNSGEEQDFHSIRDDCLENGTLFEDPEFPATDSSLLFTEKPDKYYEWKRPNEIVDDPQLFVEGFSRFDVQQGDLGDCWLLAAAANLTMYRRLFLQIVPDDQSFDDKYAGVFHFRFWQYGRWVDVVIDDRLPTYNGQLIYLHSAEENEFWSALLEKAYAKLHGSYEALKGGSTCEAMEDFTGGVAELYMLNDACPPDLFQILMKAYERSSLISCSIDPDPNVVEAETPEGLVKGHAYSITRVQKIDIHMRNITGKISLLRLRNPWGDECEWNGAWSDASPEWQLISDDDKEELGLTFDNDGEFWMSYNDFEKRFDWVEICNLNPDSLSDEELKEQHKKKWEMTVFEGEWVRGVSAGGCRNYLESFWHNPQYRITLTEVDDDNFDGCTLIVGLMQKNRRQSRQIGVELLVIGFEIYHALEEHIPEKLKEEDNIHQYFLEVARDDGEVDWVELKSILDYHMQTELGFEGFSKDICRSMVAMLDEDHSGRLGYSEFRKLWASLQDWKNVWILYDIDKSGTFSGFELRTALNSAGYSVNIRILNILMHRYGNKKGEIQFEDFMMCAIKLKTMIDIFKEKDVIECNTACFSMEDWLECTLYS